MRREHESTYTRSTANSAAAAATTAGASCSSAGRCAASSRTRAALDAGLAHETSSWIFATRSTHRTATAAAITGAELLAPGHDLSSGLVISARLVGTVAHTEFKVVVLAEASSVGGTAVELASLSKHVLDTDSLRIAVSTSIVLPSGDIFGEGAGAGVGPGGGRPGETHAAFRESLGEVLGGNSRGADHGEEDAGLHYVGLDGQMDGIFVE